MNINKIAKYNAQGELIVDNKNYKYPVYKNIPNTNLFSNNDNYSNNYNESTYLELDNIADDNNSWTSTVANIDDDDNEDDTENGNKSTIKTKKNNNCVVKIIEVTKPWYENKDILSLLEMNKNKIAFMYNSDKNKENKLTGIKNDEYNNSINKEILIIAIVSSILIGFILYKHIKNN